MEPAPNATRFECGSPNMLGAHVLNASLGLLLEIGIPRIEQMLAENIGYLICELKQIDGVELISPEPLALRAGIVTFKPPVSDIDRLHKMLMADQVICAYRGGGIRFSPAFYTRKDTMALALERLKSCIEKLKPENL